jgi:transcriptional regulator with XRE-family HTH domain
MVSPEDVGLARYGRRRVPGLRREEVAEIVGISPTWYTWLEQGRDIRASPEILQALCGLLGLDDVNRRYLYHLADAPLPPGPVDGALEPLVPFLDVFLPAPAFVVTLCQDLVAWNKAFSRLFADPETLEPTHRNVVWIMLMTPSVRTTMVDWEARAIDVIARFRASRSLDLRNPRYAEIATDLTETSDLFRRSWERHDVRRFVTRVEAFVLEDGSHLEMQVSQLRAPDHPEQLLFAYRPIDPATRERLGTLL